MMTSNYSQRIQQFQSRLEGSAELVFFPLSADLQYLTGITRDMPTFGAIRHPGGWVEGLWLSPNAAPILTLTRMTAEFNNPGEIENVIVLGEWEDPVDLLNRVMKDLKLEKVTRIALGEKTQGETFINLQAIIPNIQFSSATELLAAQRMIKADDEIALMHEAGRITEEAFSDVLKSLKHGMTELDIVLEIDFQLRSHGSFGPSFNSTIYCVGPSHELFFNQTELSSPRKLNPPVSILFDFGAIYQGYCYDFGRTVYFGTPDPDMVSVHGLVMASQAAGIAAMRGGHVKAEDVDQAAREVIESAGLGETFRHRLGHSIGLDVHEPPFLTRGDRTILEEGMLFTVEPSIIIPFANSARVEDVVLVGKDGGIPFTKGYPDLIIIP